MATDLDIRYDDWHAIHDHMSKTLRVYGNCTVEGGGFALSLEPREEQGANQLMLMMNLRATLTAESPSQQTPEYEQPWDDDGIQYNEVGFEVVGATAPPPPPLKVEDVF